MGSALVIIGDSWNAMKEQSSLLVKSGFLPTSVKTGEQALAIMMMGHELGIGPMESFAKISVIQGKPTVGAELMKAMVHRKLPNAKFDIVKSDKTECVIEAARPGGKLTQISFTLEDATAMKLVAKDNWVKMPKVMLRWRAISETCRAVFPDCLSGISYTPEELNPDLHFNEQGEVIETTAAPSKSSATVTPITPDKEATPKPAATVKEPTVIDVAIVGEAPIDTYEDVQDVPPEQRDPTLGNYVVLVKGKSNGKRLCDIPEEQIRADINFWKDKAPKADTVEFLMKARKYLGM